MECVSNTDRNEEECSYNCNIWSHNIVLNNDGTAICMTMIENFDNIKLGRQIVKMVKEIVAMFAIKILMIL